MIKKKERLIHICTNTFLHNSPYTPKQKHHNYTLVTPKIMA